MSMHRNMVGTHRRSAGNKRFSWRGVRSNTPTLDNCAQAQQSVFLPDRLPHEGLGARDQWTDNPGPEGSVPLSSMPLRPTAMSQVSTQWGGYPLNDGGCIGSITMWTFGPRRRWATHGQKPCFVQKLRPAELHMV